MPSFVCLIPCLDTARRLTRSLHLRRITRDAGREHDETMVQLRVEMTQHQSELAQQRKRTAAAVARAENADRQLHEMARARAREQHNGGATREQVGAWDRCCACRCTRCWERCWDDVICLSVFGYSVLRLGISHRARCNFSKVPHPHV